MTVTTTPSAPASELEIGPVQPHELGDAVAVLARGMRDNPLHVAAFGADAERRRARIERLFSSSAHRLGWASHMVVARNVDGTIVAACGMAPPGRCQPAPSDQIRMVPTLLGLGPGTAARVGRWMGAWAKRDSKTPHWHVGPFGVDAHLQGQGIGSALMRAFCARMDAVGDDAYLETDKAINVGFYERFGFEVVGEEDILGVRNWYMLRRAR